MRGSRCKETNQKKRKRIWPLIWYPIRKSTNANYKQILWLFTYAHDLIKLSTLTKQSIVFFSETWKLIQSLSVRFLVSFNVVKLIITWKIKLSFDSSGINCNHSQFEYKRWDTKKKHPTSIVFVINGYQDHSRSLLLTSIYSLFYKHTYFDYSVTRTCRTTLASSRIFGFNLQQGIGNFVSNFL